MVEVTIGLKKIKVRVTEVEGKLYDQCKMEEETNCITEREEEEDSEDEDLFLTSDEESQERFSDEEDEEDDRQSNVQTTVPETVLKSQTSEEKSPKEPEVFRISSHEGTHVGFSDEEVERFEFNDEEDSLVQDTFFEETSNALYTRADENSINMGKLYANGGPNTFKKLEGIDKEIEFRNSMRKEAKRWGFPATGGNTNKDISMSGQRCSSKNTNWR
ncbi:hypothetical protein L2E82_53894 [Cichorium intybus]|nr:hypothetical protein L2E82_53894 [Cichorium intybus]